MAIACSSAITKQGTFSREPARPFQWISMGLHGSGIAKMNLLLKELKNAPVVGWVSSWRRQDILLQTESACTRNDSALNTSTLSQILSQTCCGPHLKAWSHLHLPSQHQMQTSVGQVSD